MFYKAGLFSFVRNLFSALFSCVLREIFYKVGYSVFTISEVKVS